MNTIHSASNNNEAQAEPPAKPARTKSSRALLIIGGLIILLGGGYSAYINVAWERFLPSSMLFSRMGSHDRYDNEAHRRFAAGTFSNAEVADYLSALIAPPALDAPAKYPPGELIGASIYPRFRLPQSEGWQVSLHVELLVNGEVRKSNEPIPPMPLQRAQSTMLVDYPALEPGTHTLGVRSRYKIWKSGTQSDPAAVSCDTTKTTERAITIAGTMDDYADPKTSKFLAASLADRTGLVLFHAPEEEEGTWALAMSLTRDDPPINIAAEVWVRRGESKPYVKAGEYGSNSHVVFLRGDPRLVKAKMVDVLLIPSGRIAYRAGLQEYFGGTLEWRNLEVAPVAALFADELDEYVRQPDEVRNDQEAVERMKSGQSL